MNSADSARGSIAGSRERIKLGKHLNACSRALRVFADGPWDVRLTNRILRKRALEAGQAVRDLAYPALLGGRRDLKLIKYGLGQITYMLSFDDWVNIPTAVTVDNRFERVKGIQFEGLSIFNLLALALAAVPGVPVLIQAFKAIFL